MFKRAKCSVQCALCVMRRLHAFGLCPVPCLRCHVPCAMLCTMYFCWVLCAAPGTDSSMPDQAVSCVVCPVSCALCPVPCTLLSALHPPPCVCPVHVHVWPWPCLSVLPIGWVSRPCVGPPSLVGVVTLACPPMPGPAVASVAIISVALATVFCAMPAGAPTEV